MAAVTIASGFPRTSVEGSMRVWRYKFVSSVNNDTLLTPLHSVKGISVMNGDNTALGATIATSGGKQQLTFKGTGTNAFVSVFGW